MKMAFLVTAHSNFKHLKLLMSILDTGKDDVFLHIDKRAKRVPSPSELHHPYMLERQVVHWAGFSQVVVTNRLFKEAINVSDADYFVFISGTDYPVRPIEELRAYLLSSGLNHINVRDGFVDGQNIQKLIKFHPEYTRRNPRLISTQFWRVVERLGKKYFPDKKPPFPLYTGHNWCALKRDAVKYILDIVEKNKAYEEFFKYTNSPDEAYHQTILGNSSFRGSVAPYLTYTDWTGVEKPAYITEEHVELLKKNMKFETEFGIQEVFFARKFHDKLDHVVRKIDKELLA